jgi:arsenite methyltransferase
MNHTNFDWYRPLNCHRFTPEEIKQWLKKLKLCPVRFVVQDAGITVIAKKESALGHAPDFRAPIHA